MRLLQRHDDESFSLTDDLLDSEVSRYHYAILSHRWGKPSEEVTFEDMMGGIGQDKTGYEKIRFCAEQAANDGLQYFWVDSCCIKRSSDAELSEAINSMYRWYSRAAKCYVYLSDVSADDEHPLHMAIGPSFRRSEWFFRGWTLQELLAPSNVYFFSRERKLLGDKRSLSQQIHEITGIELEALQSTTLTYFSFDTRFRWAQNRITTRPEDWAYSLLGIFGVSMPPIYGEGKDRAVARLRKEISDNSFELPQSASKSAPISNVPFRRDLDFVDRGDILEEVDKRCSQPAGRAALMGLGGVGKSQLAIEYSYRVRERSPRTWLFWVHAGTQARFEEGYRKIAEAANISGWDDSTVNILPTVRSWLCDESNGRWTMIVDNADDSSVLLSSPGRQSAQSDGSAGQSVETLSAFLPQSPNGSILITTRNREAAFRLTGRHADILEVGLMEQAHAVALTRKKIQGMYEERDVTALVQALEYFPLAITQAAAYINQRTPRMTISKYVENLQKGENDRARLLDMDVGDIRRDGNAANSIIATWQISFEHIRKAKITATRLLSLMSLFDRQGIPESLLLDFYANQDDDASSFEDDLDMLLNFSLISIQIDESQFEMHRLVQFSTKRWLRVNNEFDIWNEKYLNLIRKSFPSGRSENWETCRVLYPHARAIMEHRPTDPNQIEDRAAILYRTSWYAHTTGNYQAAYEMGTEALEVTKKRLGPNNRITLRYADNLARVLRDQGKYSESQAMNELVLAGRAKVLGETHLSTLTSMHNLGSVLRYQGKYQEAEAMSRRALAGHEKELGAKHPNTLTCASNLATILQFQKKYDEAERINRWALEEYEKELGPNHPSTLTCLSNLADILLSQDKVGEAEQMTRKALAGSEEVLGPSHPDSLISLNNLACLLKTVGRDEEAIDLMETCVERRKPVLGLSHPSTKNSMSMLARWREETLNRI